MTLRRLLITASNRGAFDALRVHASQEELVAPNTAWLDRILDTEATQTMGLLEDDTPIGLYSLTNTERMPAHVIKEYFRAGHSYLWHFMLDAAAQGRGLGRAAMGLVEDHALEQKATGISLTTADRRAGSALAFYTAAGFSPTGRRLHEELELVKSLDGARHA